MSVHSTDHPDYLRSYELKLIKQRVTDNQDLRDLLVAKLALVTRQLDSDIRKVNLHDKLTEVPNAGI